MKLYLTAKFHHVAHDIADKLSLEQKQNVVYITTPFKYRQFNESELDWHYNNLKAMEVNGFKYDFYDIIGKTSSDFERDLSKYQTMYVEGGNAFFFMQEAHKNNFGDYLKKRLNEGMIYISESAGSIVMGSDLSANSRPGKSVADYDLPNSSGFGFVNFAILPHWGQTEKREDYMLYKMPNAYHDDYPYILLANHQYVEVTDDRCKIIEVTKE